MIRDPVEIAKNWRLFTVFTSPGLVVNGKLIRCRGTRFIRECVALKRFIKQCANGALAGLADDTTDLFSIGKRHDR